MGNYRSHKGIGMENFQHLSTEASSSSKTEKGLEKAIVLSPLGQFSALAGEAQDLNESKDDQSDDSGTMEDYWTHSLRFRPRSSAN